MTRSQRSVHRALWLVLALVVGLGFALALGLRPSKSAEAVDVTFTESMR
jgi:hypothetical protein